MVNAGVVSGFPLTNLSLICDDPDGDGQLEIPSCVSWTQPGGDRVCPDDADGNGVPGQITDFRGATLPANKSKCNCDPFFVPIEILAQLTLEKDVVNDDGGTAADTDWTLSFSGPDNGSGPEGDAAVTAVPVTPGVYTLTESNGPAGYDEGSWTCTDGTLVGNVLTLASGDIATCTITNDDQPAFLILEKTVTNDDGGTAVESDFQAYIDGSPVAWDVATSVGAGSFTASEDVVTGYTASSWGGDCAADGSVTLANGETKTCTITNDDNPATLTLVKTVINDDGGTAVEDDFQAYIDGSPVPWNVAQSVGAGSFTASEDVVAGYTASSWGGDCAADGSVTLALGENKTCTITNDDDPAFLILEKTVVNDDGGTAVESDFQAYIDGSPVNWDASNSVGAGSFTASEDVVAGYTASSWGGDCAADGSVTLALGETKTCTITNDDDPATLTLVKTVINDDGGTAVEDDFQAYINGSPVAWGAHSVGAGSFTASEDVVAGYTAGSWGGDCAADGSVTLALGENKTCTITNDDQPAFLTLNKIVINDHGGTAVANDFQAQINGGNVPWGVAQSVGAGSFTASEIGVAGYTASSWSGDCAADGSVSLALGESKTCSITNDDDPAHLRLIKVVVNDDAGSSVATDWELTAAGPTGFSGFGDVEQDVAAGTYTLSETGPLGYIASNWTCVGGTQNGNQITLGLGESATCTITNDDIEACKVGDRLTSVTLKLVSASPNPIQIAWTDDNGNLNRASILGSVDPATAGVTEFTVTPEAPNQFFDSQNLRFYLGDPGGALEASNSLKVHLSCSDDPYIGQQHSGTADGYSATLEKTGFVSTPFSN